MMWHGISIVHYNVTTKMYYIELWAVSQGLYKYKKTIFVTLERLAEILLEGSKRENFTFDFDYGRVIYT